MHCVYSTNDLKFAKSFVFFSLSTQVYTNGKRFMSYSHYAFAESLFAMFVCVSNPNQKSTTFVTK